MRQISKLISYSSAAVVFLSLSGSAMAVTASPTPSTKKVTISCSNASSVYGLLTKDVDKRVGDLKEARKRGDANLAKNRVNEDKARMKTRTNTIKKHETYIQNIKNLFKGETDLLAATEQYDKDLRAAFNIYWHGDPTDVMYDEKTYAPNITVTVDKTPSVDGAVADYRVKQDQAIKVRRESVDTAVRTLKTEYFNASQELKAACARKDSNAVYNFNAAKKSAVKKYDNSYSSAQTTYRDKIKNELKPARDAYITTAKANFKSAKDLALNTFLSKLGVDKEGPSGLNSVFIAPPTKPIPTSQSPVELSIQVDKGLEVSKVEWFLGSLDKKNMVTEKGVADVYQKHSWDISKLQTGKYKWFARVYDKDGKRYNVKAPDNKDFIEVSLIKV